MSESVALRQRLLLCPPGQPGWRAYEDTCIDVLSHLFVPPLQAPIIQARTLSGVDRRDAVFPNRNFGATNTWGHLLRELNARMVLFEFKNYDEMEIGKEETIQTCGYLTSPMGKLAIICCNRTPNQSAHIKRNTIFSQDGKVVLFLTTDHLVEMLFIKERGEDPSDLLMDLLERFYIQYE